MPSKDTPERGEDDPVVIELCRRIKHQELTEDPRFKFARVASTWHAPPKPRPGDCEKVQRCIERRQRAPEGGGTPPISRTELKKRMWRIKRCDLNLALYELYMEGVIECHKDRTDYHRKATGPVPEFYTLRGDHFLNGMDYESPWDECARLREELQKCTQAKDSEGERQCRQMLTVAEHYAAVSENIRKAGEADVKTATGDIDFTGQWYDFFEIILALYCKRLIDVVLRSAPSPVDVPRGEEETDQHLKERTAYLHSIAARDIYTWRGEGGVE